MSHADADGHQVRLVFPSLATFYSLAEPLGYAALRVWFGMTLLTHGYPKVFRVPHGAIADPYANLVNVIGNKLGLPAPELLALLVTFLESGGAIMLAAGLGTRIIAPMLAVQMVVIALGVHWPAWGWTQHGMEYSLLMGALAGYMSLRGGGRYSLDRLIGREI